MGIPVIASPRIDCHLATVRNILYKDLYKTPSIYRYHKIGGAQNDR